MSDDFGSYPDPQGPQEPPALSPEDEAAVHELLAALPDPEVPSDVQERIAAALAAPVPQATTTVLPAAETILGSPPPPPSRRWRNPRLLQAAAALVIVGLVTALGIGFVSRGGSSDSTGGAVAGGASTPVTVSGTAYTTASLAADVQTLLGAGAATQPGVEAQSTPDGASAADAPGTAKTPSPVIASAKGRAAAAALVRDPTTRQACLARLDTPPGQQPLAIDVGAFDGKAAAVIVLPNEKDASYVDVWVVGPTCSDADNPFPYQYQRVPRP